MIGKKLNKIYFFTYYFFGDKMIFKRLFFDIFFSIIFIYFFNYFFVSFSIPINAVTVFIYSFLGFFGFLGLFIFRFFIM